MQLISTCTVLTLILCAVLHSKLTPLEGTYNPAITQGIDWHSSITSPAANCHHKPYLSSLLLTIKLRPKPLSTKPAALLYLSALLLANACDTETNPGPGPRRAVKFPCGTCGKNVGYNHRGVQCESCDTWYHTNCQGISLPIYRAMNSSNVSWHCLQCGLPNFSSTLFNSPPSIASTNRFDSLSSFSDMSNSPGQPLAASSPSDTTHQTRQPPHRRRVAPLTVLVINCQSIVNKKALLSTTIDSHKPDIIIGTESWLRNDIHTSEIFPSNFDVYRRDRQKRQGAVYS